MMVGCPEVNLFVLGMLFKSPLEAACHMTLGTEKLLYRDLSRACLNGRFSA